MKIIDLGLVIPSLVLLLCCIRVTLGTQGAEKYNECPFRNIKLTQYPEHFTYPNAGERLLGFGGFEANGPVKEFVTKRQFVKFTRHLVKQVFDKWNAAPEEQKGIRSPARPPQPPVCSGILMGTGRDLEYAFVSQVRPFRKPDIGWKGASLFSQSQDKTVDARFPNFLQSGKELKHHLLVLRKHLIYRAEDLRLQSLNRPSSSEEHYLMKKLQKDLKDEAHAITIHLERLEKKADDVREEFRHVKHNDCSECTIIGRIADRGQTELLKGAWLVSFGIIKGRNNNFWGIQNACTGSSTRYGCKDLLQHNGVQDLFEVGLALSQRRGSRALKEIKRDIAISQDSELSN